MEFKPFNLAEAYGNAQNLAANKLKLDELANMAQAKQGLQQAVSAGTPDAMDLYRKQFPVQAREWDAGNLQLSSAKLKQAMDKAAYIGQLAAGVSDEQSYQSALEEAKRAGIPVHNAPRNYDPRWVQQTIQQALTVKDRLSMMAKEDHAPMEVYDPNSPTGTRLVSRKEAIGKPGKPPSGFSIEMGPDGKVTRIAQGRGSSGMSPRTTGETQDRILKGGDTMGQLKSIQRLYRPEFQQIGNKWSNYMTAWKDKAGMKLDEAERKKLKDFTQYRAEAAQLFSLTLKDLSGVAVNPTEFERAKSWLPSPGTGIFDGDSPTELEAKRQRFEDFTRRALIKYNYINKHGLSKNDIDVDDIPALVSKRGDELAAQLKARGVTGEELKRQVKTLLSDEFGFGLMQ